MPTRLSGEFTPTHHMIRHKQDRALTVIFDTQTYSTIHRNINLPRASGSKPNVTRSLIVYGRVLSLAVLYILSFQLNTSRFRSYKTSNCFIGLLNLTLARR